MFLKQTLLFLVLCSCTACFQIQSGKPFKRIAPGAWRAVFLVGASGENLEQQKAAIDVWVEGSDEGQAAIKMYFKNGDQQFAADSLRFLNDTIWVFFKNQDSYLKGIYEIGLMKGELYRLSDNSPLGLAFDAQHGQFQRFPDLRIKPDFELSGSWDFSLAQANDSTEQKGLLVLQHKGNKAQGQWIFQEDTLSLAGTVQGPQILLSGFDGRHAVFIKAKVQGEKEIRSAAVYWDGYSFGAEASKR
jgi:hypothetical protein